MKLFLYKNKRNRDDGNIDSNKKLQVVDPELRFCEFNPLPENRPLNKNIPHAPTRVNNLNREEKMV